MLVFERIIQLIIKKKMKIYYHIEQKQIHAVVGVAFSGISLNRIRYIIKLLF